MTAVEPPDGPQFCSGIECTQRSCTVRPLRRFQEIVVNVCGAVQQRSHPTGAGERLPVVAVRYALLELVMTHNPILNLEVEIMTRRNARRFLALRLRFRVEGFCHRTLNDRHSEDPSKRIRKQRIDGLRFIQFLRHSLHHRISERVVGISLSCSGFRISAGSTDRGAESRHPLHDLKRPTNSL
jgi:hypothetical protein